MTQIWNGERLPPGPTAAVLIEAPPSGNQPSLPLMAAAAAGDETIVFALDRLDQFFTLHRDRELVCENAAQLHWAAADLLQRENSADALGALWVLSAENRLIDLVILDQLVALGEGDALRYDLDLGELAVRHCCLVAPKMDVLGRELLRQCRQGRAIGLLDQPLVNDIGDFASALLRVHAILIDRVRNVAAAARVDVARLQRYGPLALGMEVQAAIGLHKSPRLLAFERQAIEPAIANQRERFRRHARLLDERRESHGRFHLRDPNAVEPRLEIGSNQLRTLLDETSSEIMDSIGVSVRKPRADDGELSMVPSHWGRLCNGHPVLHSWSETVAASRSIRFLRQLSQERLCVTPRLLPRLSGVAVAGLDNHGSLHDLIGEGVLRPPCKHVFAIARLENLELAALAAVCEHLFGFSRIAELLRAGQDPIASAVGSFRGPQGSGATGEFRQGRERIWRAAAVALLETTALKLAPESARWILASRDDLEVSPAELCQMQTQMVETFPELRQYVEEIIDVFAGNLEFSSERVRTYLGAAATIADLYRFMVDRHEPSGARLPGPEIDPGLGQKIHLRFGLPRPIERVFYRHYSTPAGRVRASARFSEDVAEYLDLADQAVKAAIYAIAAAGYQVAGCARYEIAVAISEDDQTERIAEELAMLARDAATNLLADIPVVCRTNFQSTW